MIFTHSDDSLGPAGTDEWHAFIRDSEDNLLGPGHERARLSGRVSAPSGGWGIMETLPTAAEGGAMAHDHAPGRDADRGSCSGPSA